jgi:hypothetical protein
MRNEGFAVHNTSEARDCMNTPTRGLNHSVTGRRILRNARTAQKPPGRAKRTLEASPRGLGLRAYLSPLPLSSSPELMDS